MTSEAEFAMLWNHFVDCWKSDKPSHSVVNVRHSECLKFTTQIYTGWYVPLSLNHELCVILSIGICGDCREMLPATFLGDIGKETLSCQLSRIIRESAGYRTNLPYG